MKNGLLVSLYVELLQRFLVKKLRQKTKETYRFNVVRRIAYKEEGFYYISR